MQNEIRHTWHFTQSPKEVWEYLTRPELMAQWLMKSDFQPIVGHRFTFIGGCDPSEPKAAATCEVLDVSPFTHLSYAWTTNSLLDSKPFDSKVSWTLVPVGSGTELQLVHNGFTALEDVVAHNDGWTRCGNRLAALSKPAIQ